MISQVNQVNSPWFGWSRSVSGRSVASGCGGTVRHCASRTTSSPSSPAPAGRDTASALTAALRAATIAAAAVFVRTCSGDLTTLVSPLGSTLPMAPQPQVHLLKGCAVVVVAAAASSRLELEASRAVYTIHIVCIAWAAAGSFPRAGAGRRPPKGCRYGKGALASWDRQG